MNTLVFIVGLAVLAGAVAAIAMKSITWSKQAIAAERGGRPEPPKPKGGAFRVAVAAVGVIVMLLSACFTIVPTGYTGVRTTFGLIDQTSCRPGFNSIIPLAQDISLVNNKQQDLRFTERIWSETKEQTVVYMENVQVVYQIVPEASAWIYANVENWIEQLIDQDMVGSSLKAASRSLGADVVTDRAVIEPLSRQKLQEKVDDKYGQGKVVIKAVIINNMDFDDSYNAAIARKSEAIQEQQEKAIRNQTKIDEAKATAEAERAIAQGKADAARIEAEGKAEANRKLVDSITATTQLQDIIDKWNGALPKYSGVDGGLFGILESEAATAD